MSLHSQNSRKISEGGQKIEGENNQQIQQQLSPQISSQQPQISKEQKEESQTENVKTQNLTEKQNIQPKNNENESQNSNAKNATQQVQSGYSSDDEVRINPDLEKFFKRREFMDQINRPMLRSNQNRLDDKNNDCNEDETQNSKSNQRREIKQNGFINKQEQNNVQKKLTKLKHYSDKLSNAIKSLQAWEEPINNMGAGKTFDEKFEIAESMLHRWQDLGLVDGPVTEDMMMKYPEYEQQIQSEKFKQIRIPHQNSKDKYNQSQSNQNYLCQEEQDEETTRNNIKFRNARDGSSNTRNKFIIKDQVRSIQQSPRLNTEKIAKDEYSRQQQQYIPNDMLATQNKFRNSSQQNPKRHINMIDEQIIRNLNETKFLEDQKNLIISNNFKSSKPQYRYNQLSTTQPFQQNGNNSNDYGQYSTVNNTNNGNYQLNRPRLKTPKRGEKQNTPIEYNEAITSEIEKQYRMRYSSAEPRQNELYDISSSGNGYSKYGNSLNNNYPQSVKKDNFRNINRNQDDNEISSFFPQIHNYSETFQLSSGGKLRNSVIQQRGETPKKRINYGSQAYPHGSYLSNGTSKYQQ